MIKLEEDINQLIASYPSTRYMGSKRKVLPFLHDALSKLEFNSCLDAFSGSGVVSYYFKRLGKQVYSNDFMRFPYMYNLATVENQSEQLSDGDVGFLLSSNPNPRSFIQETFQGIYFNDEDNAFLDNVRSNIDLLPNDILKSIALSALVRTCLKKRPRGIFTYVGERYNDGRKDLLQSFEEHFRTNVQLFNDAVFDNGQDNRSFNQDIFTLDVQPDLVYLDPPYYSKKSDNDYTRRYHFVEGLVKYWEGLEIQTETKTKKFKKYSTPFDSRTQVYDAFKRLFEKFADSTLVVSYSSNSLPSKDEMIELMGAVKNNVEVLELDYLYSFGNQGHKVNDNANKVKEYLFIGT
jgi:DNA adenine methylase